MIHSSSSRPGTQSSVLRTKNGVQPSASASVPPDADKVVRPDRASEDSSAYCVAVKATLHSPDR